jgi:hypothetical protein
MTERNNGSKRNSAADERQNVGMVCMIYICVMLSVCPALTSSTLSCTTSTSYQLLPPIAGKLKHHNRHQERQVFVQE